MAAVIDRVRGRITGYDERRGVVLIEAPYSDFAAMCRREYDEVDITMIDSRPLSARQRRSCYAMIREIAAWMGEMNATDAQEATEKAFHSALKRSRSEATKEWAKLRFWCDELQETADGLFSLSDAPMSVVAAFQSWLARFIVRNDIPTQRPMLEYVDDVQDYVYACLVNKKCPICGKKADLHHVTAIGMGRDRDEIIHEGMEVMPLCREHHTEIHTIGKADFFKKWHLQGGIECDKTICRIYGLKRSKKSESV